MGNRIANISLEQLIRALWRTKWWILLTAVVFGSLGFGYSKYLVKPTYTSTTRLYVVNRTENDKTVDGLSNQDLQAGSALTKDYREIILSEDVILKAMSELRKTGTYSSFVSDIVVSVPTDTRIISISVNNKNPKEAARIANVLRQVSAEKIIEVTQVSDVTTLQEGRVPSRPSSPNVRRNAVLGVVLGAALGVLVTLTKEVLDDRVKRFEDFEKLDMPLLGSIPLVKDVK